MKIYTPQQIRTFITLLLVTTLFTSMVNAQDATFLKQLEKSHYVNRVMEEDASHAGLTRWAQKKVERTRILPLAGEFDALRINGPGTLEIEHDNARSKAGSILLKTPSSLSVKNPTNRAYAFSEMIRPLKGEDLRGYNRFSVWVYADVPGFYSVFVGCTLYNEGEQVMPTPGRFEGQHYVTVYPDKWQQIIWEIPDLYRDSVTGFSVNLMLSGSPMGASDSMKLYIDDMRIEQVDAENTRGFDLRENAIAYCHSGYRLGSVKQALVQNNPGRNFSLLDEENEVVFKGEGFPMQNGFMQLDFSDFNTPGYYTLKSGNIISKPFAIGENAWLATAWRTLNFFYAERCGFEQPGIHQECHRDVFCVHPDGRRIQVNGGWHDAADLTQGVGNTALGGMAMLELAKAVKQSNEPLYDRLVEEARWGLNWILKTRFGDGYRHGGMIIGIWTDNITGTKDDMESRASNNPANNFIAASYCAMAVPFFEESDPVFARWCKNSALEDFEFASAILNTYESSMNEVEMYSLAMVAAMQLYRLTLEQSYLELGASYAQIVMECQQMSRRTDWSSPLHGFFYESREKKRILEFFHRSNEELMIQGLNMLLTDAPNHEQAPEWEASCRAYSDYLHEISGLISPYGILPAAIYELNNADFSGIYHEGEQLGMPSMEE